MADLLGGTTGQVLAKASNTDMDFSWVAQDDSNAIQNSIVDAKGDLIGATANDTPARLAVGTNGQVLTADSTASTGLAWATPTATPTSYGYTAGKNKVINGDFSVWQRGTSVNTTTFGYTADRWLGYQYGSVTVSRQATADTTNLPSIQYCGRVQRPAAQTGLNPIYLSQSIESSASIPFSGQTVTLSFYARRGSNYSSASNILTAQVISGTGTDQNVNVGGFTGSVQVSAPNVTLTTTWQRFTTTGTVGTNATQLGVVFTYTPVGTAGTNDYFEVTGVQLEAGTATTFASASGGSPEAELAMCQRYFQRIDATNGTTFSPFGSGQAVTTLLAYSTVTYAIKRTSPSLSFATAANFQTTAINGAGITLSAIGTAASSVNSALVEATVAAGLVAGNASILYRNAGSSPCYIDISAEL
jgi:hypothetical protein